MRVRGTATRTPASGGGKRPISPSNRKRIRSGSGIGDNIYLQAIVRHLVEKGERLEVCTKWPELFLPLKGKVSVNEFSRLSINIICHYVTRKHVKDTDQFQDMCIFAGIKEPVDLRIDWTVQDTEIIERIKFAASGKPICVLKSPHSPMGRTDKFAEELTPEYDKLQLICDSVGDVFTVQIGGRGKKLHQMRCDMDMCGQTTLTQMMDIASVADLFVGQVGFVIPLAESFDKPVVALFADRGLKSKNKFISSVTPAKIMHRKTSFGVIDSWTPKRIQEICNRATVGL